MTADNDCLPWRLDQNIVGTTVKMDDGREIQVQFKEPVTCYRGIALNGIAKKMLERGEEPVGLY